MKSNELQQSMTIPKIILLFLVWQLILPVISMFMLACFDGLAGTSYADSNLIQFLIIDSLAALIFLRYYKKNITSNLLNKRDMSFLPVGIVLAVCVGDCTTKAMGLLPNYEQLATAYEELMDGFEGNFTLQIFVIAIITPIVEEVFFRGIVYEQLKVKYSMWVSIIISSAIFGIAHAVPLQIISTFIAGIVMCIVYEKYHNIFFPIFIHIVNNLLSVLEFEFAAEASVWVQILITFVEIVVVGAIMIKFFLPLKEKEGVLEHEEQACSS